MTSEYDSRTRGSSANDSSMPGDARTPRPADDSSFTTLRDNVIEALRILALRRWTFFIPFCIVTATLAVSSLWLKRTYKSTTVIERRDHPVLMNLRQTAATGEFSRFFRPTLERDIKSMEAMQEVVTNLGLVDLQYNPDGTMTDDSLRSVRAKAASLMGGVSATVVQKADHYDEIRIAFEGAEPYLPKRVVEEVKDTYIRWMRAKLVDMLNEGMAYFQGEADSRRDEISTLEEEILRFQAEYLGVDPTNPGALKLKLTSLESEQDELNRTIASLGSEVDARKAMITVYQSQASAKQAEAHRLADQSVVGVPAPLVKSAAATAIEKEIRRLQDEVHDLQLTRRMTDLHPDIVEHRERIARLREDLKARYLADAEATAAAPQVPLTDAEADIAVERAVGLDMELVNLRMDLQDRENRLASAESRLRTVEADIARHEKLQQNVFRYRKDFQLKSEQLDQARKDHALNMRRVNEIASIVNADESQRGVSFTVRSAPSGGVKPIRPKGLAVLAGVILAGLAAGAIGVLIREVFDQTYHTAKQVTRSLGIAILESVDEIVTSADRARLFRRRVIYAPAVISALVLAVGLCCGAAYLSIEDPRTYQRAMSKPRYLYQRLMGATESAGIHDANDRNAPDASQLPPAVKVATGANETDTKPAAMALTGGDENS
ncbi:MAG: hypothetical protein H6817_04350 [Phycisphaerales bacterium]|nr:hypothetical protein [Phycisphaerales bacterium]